MSTCFAECGSWLRSDTCTVASLLWQVSSALSGCIDSGSVSESAVTLSEILPDVEPPRLHYFTPWTPPYGCLENATTDARNFREVLNNSKPVVTTMDSGYSCASDANAPPASTSSHPSLGRAPMTEDSLEARQMRVLDRLVSDLTLSVPAVLIMTCYYPVRMLIRGSR